MTKESFAIAEAYKRVFETTDGQVVLDDLRKAYTKHTSFDPNPHTMAFLEGHRNVILRMEYLISAANNPEAIEEDHARTSYEHGTGPDPDSRLNTGYF